MEMTIGLLRKTKFGPFTITANDILNKHYTLSGDDKAAELQKQMRELLNNKELLEKITDALKEKKFNIKDLNITGLAVTSTTLDKAREDYKNAKQKVKDYGEQYENERKQALIKLQSESGKLNKIRGDLGEYITKLILSGVQYKALEEKRILDETVENLVIQGGQKVTHGKSFVGKEYKVSSQQKADITFSTGINEAMAGISIKNYQNLHNYISLYSRETKLMGLVSEWDNNSVNGLKFLQSLALYDKKGQDKEARQTGESFMAIQAFMGAGINNLNASDMAQYFALYTNNTAYVKFIPSLLKKAFSNIQGNIYQYFRFKYNPPLKEMKSIKKEKTVDEVFGQAHVGITATQQIINLIMAQKA